MQPVYRLTISCPDAVGIVAKVSQFLAQHNGTITEANHHADLSSGWFFMRNEIRADSMPFELPEFCEAFAPIAQSLNMKWKITDSRIKPKVILMVSKQNHCLADLLNRWHNAELDCEICAVISNHDDLSEQVNWYGLKYHHVPMDKDSKQVHFDEVAKLIEQYQAQTIVLARYMQILPPSVCEKYNGQIINIHHSFLPSFAGAKPYHQAYDRGVKLIGATCHYVTQELDAGPIIDQDVARITHRDVAQEMVRLGKDVERSVLARGLRWHLQDRVIVHGNKTVVFS